MNPKFEVDFLEDAVDFLESLDEKSRRKIIFNIDKSRYVNDPKLFKKLTKDIWEFRTKYQKSQYRLFAFWDKRDNKNTLVISTHGMIKKRSKVPKGEIEKAEKLMEDYFDSTSDD
jgi:phage-related protein